MTMIYGLLILGLLAYEAVALTNKRPGDTISELMWAASRRPIVPFALGVLMGHFFWQQGSY